ncbi:hypothetical protein O0L34_g10628 [Tuta absoluta]|nr:hypothetical protein O0L34_g10628 [Tuta absoluta]
MAATMVETPPPQLITTIEWSMMDKSKFFPLYTLSSFTVRCALYPLTLIKTQIQVQRKKEAYSGVFDAITKIYRNEGVSGLYRGFWLSSFQIISGVFYITTYEGVRHELGRYEISPRAKSFIAGGCASLVGQTIIVPFDVLSQHLMVLGLVKGRSKAGMSTATLNPLGLDLDKRLSKAALAREVASRVYTLHGALGYYRGYAASLAAYVPNSALWWALYQAYQGEWGSRGCVPNSALYQAYQGEWGSRGCVPNSALYQAYQGEWGSRGCVPNSALYQAYQGEWGSRGCVPNSALYQAYQGEWGSRGCVPNSALYQAYQGE